MQRDMLTVGCYILSAIIPLAVFLSCAHTKSVSGEWKEIEGASIIELRKDGSFYAVDGMGMAVSGTYTLQENGSIRFEILHEGSSSEIVYGVINAQGDELIFSSDDTVEKYKKVYR